MTRRFVAKYGGKCLCCGEQIEAGDTGTYWQTGEQGEDRIWEVVGGKQTTNDETEAGTDETKES